MPLLTAWNLFRLNWLRRTSPFHLSPAPHVYPTPNGPYIPPRQHFCSTNGHTVYLEGTFLFSQSHWVLWEKVALFFLLTDIVLLASKPPPSQSGNSWIRTAFRFWAFWKPNQSKNHFELLWKETIGIPCLPWPLSKCLHWFVDLFGFQTSSHHCQRGLSILPTSYQCLLHQDQLLVIVSVLSSNNFLQYLLSTGIKGSSLWHEFYRNKEIYNHRIIL